MTDRWYDEGGYLLPILWVTPIEECSIQTYIHDAHEIMLSDLTTKQCPGLGKRNA